MNDVVQFLSTHPLAVMALVFVVLLIVYFLFKQLVKMALLMIIVLLGLGGYFYFKYPGHTWEHMKGTLQKAKTGAVGTVQKGKEAYQEGKKLFKEGKELTQDLKKAIKKEKKEEEE